MTIIAYKNGECWADDIITESYGLIAGRELKLVYRKKDGVIGGAAGDAAACSEFLQWVKSGRKKFPAKLGEGSLIQAFTVDRSGIVSEWSGPVPSLISCDHYAIGKGSEIAIGAMMAGASAKEACMYACRGYAWPASLQGVDHDGKWSSCSIEEVYSPVHGTRTPQVPPQTNRRRN